MVKLRSQAVTSECWLMHAATRLTAHLNKVSKLALRYGILRIFCSLLLQLQGGGAGCQPGGHLPPLGHDRGCGHCPRHPDTRVRSFGAALCGQEEGARGTDTLLLAQKETGRMSGVPGLNSHSLKRTKANAKLPCLISYSKRNSRHWIVESGMLLFALFLGVTVHPDL
jgi:hypothetical protein